MLNSLRLNLLGKPLRCRTSVSWLSGLVLTYVLVIVFTKPVLAQDLDPSGQDKPIPAVKVIEPNDSSRLLVRRFFGVIVARDTVDVGFEVGGRLKDIPVAEGQVIAAGSFIAGLELEAFEREVTRAEIELERAERDRDRADQLSASNAVSAVRAQDAETARDLAEVALNDARANLDDATLYAPFDALVAARLTPSFSLVDPGEPVLRLHDMSRIRVEIDVPERLFTSGIPAEAVTFLGEAQSLSDPVPLKLIEFETETELVGQTYKATLELPETDAGGLVPGAAMTVTATADIDYGLPGVAVPASAIVTNADRSVSVMLFEPESEEDVGKVRKLDVEVLSTSGTDLRIIGLPENAFVIGAGVHLLTDGQNVRRFTGFTFEE